MTEGDALSLSSYQAVFCSFQCFTAADDLNDQVYDIHCPDQSFLYFLTGCFLFQQRSVFPGVDFHLEPVSYTHLDVYKRQVLAVTVPVAPGTILTVSVSVTTGTILTVAVPIATGTTLALSLIHILNVIAISFYSHLSLKREMICCSQKYRHR